MIRYGSDRLAAGECPVNNGPRRRGGCFRTGVLVEGKVAHYSIRNMALVSAVSWRKQLVRNSLSGGARMCESFSFDLLTVRENCGKGRSYRRRSDRWGHICRAFLGEGPSEFECILWRLEIGRAYRCSLERRFKFDDLLRRRCRKLHEHVQGEGKLSSQVASTGQIVF